MSNVNELIDIPTNLPSDELIDIPQALSNNGASSASTYSSNSMQPRACSINMGSCGTCQLATQSPNECTTLMESGGCLPSAENCGSSQGCNSCEIACETGCEVSCQTTCEKSCQNCEGACMDGCQLGIGCQDICETSICQDACELGVCQDACELGFCQTICESSCQNCEGNSCLTICQNCEGLCMNACQVGTSCQITCENACQNCETTCEKSCQNCEGACMTGCQVSCETGCQVSCETACEKSCQNCEGNSCLTVCQDCQSSCELNSQRPDNWEWISPVGKNLEVALLENKPWYLTAAEWNAFTARINQFRNYKGLATAAFTTAVKGQPMLAAQINEAINAINDMNPSTPAPNLTASYTPVIAQLVIELANALNSVL